MIFTRGLYFNPSYTKVLCLYQDKWDEWVPPGGGVEINEFPSTALEREYFEEIGVELIDYSLIYEGFMEFSGNCWKAFIYHVTEFQGVPYIKEPSKHSALDFISIDKIHRKYIPIAQSIIDLRELSR